MVTGLRDRIDIRLFEYLSDNYGSIADLIEQFGADCNCAGNDLRYRSERLCIYDEWESELWEYLREKANEHDVTVLELLARDKRSVEVDHLVELKSLIVWTVVEDWSYIYLTALNYVKTDLDWQNRDNDDRAYIYRQNCLEVPTDLTLPTQELINQLVLDCTYGV